MQIFMVSINWRGPLNIDAMRTYPTEQECWDYGDKIQDMGGTIKVYELFSDKPPRLCKKPKIPKSS